MGFCYQVQKSIEDEAKSKSKSENVNNNNAVVPQTANNLQSLYPVLSEYMGLDITEESRRHDAIAKSKTANVSSILYNLIMC